MKKERPKKLVKDLRVPVFKTAGRLEKHFDQNFKNCLEAFKARKINFSVHENFNCKKIIWEQDGKMKKRIFTFAFTHKSIFAISGYLRRDINAKILDFEKVKLLNIFKTSQRYVYKEKNCLVGYQYDIKNAFTSFLRSMQLISPEVHKKLLEFKTNGMNINKILGMALLGDTAISEYKKGNRQPYSLEKSYTEEEQKERTKREARSVIFGFAYYLTTSTLSKLCERFNENAIARYIDSFIVNKKMDIDYLQAEILQAEMEIYSRTDLNFYKYYGIHISELFTPDNPEDNALEGLFNFHEQRIESVIYTYDEYKHRELNFYRETKDKLKLEKVTYRTNEEVNIFS